MKTLIKYTLLAITNLQGFKNLGGLRVVGRIVCLLFYFTLTVSCAQPSKQDRLVGTRCEDCEMMFEGMPAKLSASTTIAPANEPGEKMIITGTIYKPDGKTPAADVILYVYHTDAKGNYSPAPNQKQTVVHGHLRGWVKTGVNGVYSITTIRPASYPNGRAPQHIHPIIKEPGISSYWIDEYLFDDDPFLTEEEKKRQKKRGGSGIIHLTKNAQGVWVGKRDIILGLNIPNY